MKFNDDFYGVGLPQPINVKGGYNEGGRGLSNVDVCPTGEARSLVITGKMKMFDFDENYYYPAKKALICIIISRKIFNYLLKWALRFIE